MRINKLVRESWPAFRFIGKKYSGPANWDEWWANGWFETLEALPLSALNQDGYTEAIHAAAGQPEHWLGMFFPENTTPPEGFQWVDFPAMDCAVCYLYGSQEELFRPEAPNQCLLALAEQGMEHQDGDWCFQRCACPGFTTPDEQGNVILDYIISIQKDNEKGTLQSKHMAEKQ